MQHCLCVLILCVYGVLNPYGAYATVYPEKHWKRDTRGNNDTVLLALSQQIGGDGCILLDGKILYAWGKIDRHRDWASASKPILSTLLFYALDRGLVHCVDDRPVDYGVPLKGKDTTITFRSLGAMTSGYALSEAAGQAYAYNDYAIQLYKHTLFEYVYKCSPKDATAPLFTAINVEDPYVYYSLGAYKERISLSVRDYARLVWLWRNRGQWDRQQVISGKLFKKYMRPQVPYDIPHATPCEQTNDYLKIGTYGGGTDHFTHSGPGVYGFNWWFNRPSSQNDGRLLFPSLPDDLILALGVRGHLALFSPKRNYALITSFGCWGDVGTKTWTPAHEALLKQFIQHMEQTYKR